MPFIDRDGVTIRFEVHGRGPPVLLSHAFGTTMRLWDRQVAGLGDRNRIILWDMRGHGGSGDPVDPAAYSQALTVGDMAAILDACGIERAVIGGVGLGGYMSLAFHEAQRQRVEALVLSDTGAGFRNHETRTAWNYRARARAHKLELKGLDALGRGREVLLACHRSALGLAAAARGMLVQHDSLLLEALPAVAVPTLILVGANDSDFFAAATTMAATIPGARRVVIPGAGATPNLDQPRVFNRALGAFLDALRENEPPPPVRRPRPFTPSPTAGWVPFR
ncbi:MAG TPA: alpha/beta fold hydrolase [Stellaceae bacterium]|jgi:pimeloyl-ACP methyl ester carboxylesterase